MNAIINNVSEVGLVKIYYIIINLSDIEDTNLVINQVQRSLGLK